MDNVIRLVNILEDHEVYFGNGKFDADDRVLAENFVNIVIQNWMMPVDEGEPVGDTKTFWLMQVVDGSGVIAYRIFRCTGDVFASHIAQYKAHSVFKPIQWMELPS